jgi:hypothetical protein
MDKDFVNVKLGSFLLIRLVSQMLVQQMIRIQKLVHKENVSAWKIMF